MPGGGTGTGGDPVDLFTGLFTYGRTDLSIQDVIPISVSRTYRQADDTSRAFGIGTNLSYDLFLVGDVFPYTYQYLILPNGGHVYFPRISTGTSYGDAVYQAQACPGSVFYGAIMRWDTSVPHSSWSLTLKSGTIYYFPDSYMATNARVAAAIMIRDRHGNTVTLNRDGNGNLTQIVSPNGRQITLTYDGSNRIHQATDDLGRLVTYDYDAAGRLQKVTDPMGFAEQYAYQTQLVVPTQSIGGVSSTTNLTQVTDRRGNPKITNTYDGNGRVIKQVYADGTFDTFAYTIHSIPAPATVMVPGGGGNAGTNVGVVTQVDSMNERGTTTRRLFDANGYVISLTRALGLPEQQTHTYVRDPATSLVTSETDSLGRTTAYQYDAVGNITKITRLYGTPNAVSSTMTYDPTYNQLTSVTDPNNNTTTLTYDAYGNLTQATDALGHSVKTVYDAEGRPTSIQDALSHVRSLSYQGADLASTTDPLGNTVRYFADQVGRTTSVIDPMGNASYLAYDNLDRVRQATDAKGNVTSKTYDQNGNVLTLVDQNLNTTSFSYDSRNRVAGSKDALLQASTQSYEPGGRVSQVIDRNGQVSGVTQFDGLGRPLQQGFGAQFRRFQLRAVAAEPAELVAEAADQAVEAALERRRPLDHRQLVLALVGGVEVHRDDQVGVAGHHRHDRQRVEQAAIDQHARALHHRGEQAGNGRRGAHGLVQVAFLEPDFLLVGEVGGHRRERDNQILDVHLAEDFANAPEDLLAAHHAQRETHVHQAQHVQVVEAFDPGAVFR